MKKIKIKYEILISGFPELLVDYKFRGFSLKKYYIKDSTMEEYDLFNTNLVLSHCMFIDNDNKKSVYYLENDDFVEYEIQNKLILTKEKIPELCSKYPNILNNVYNLILEMRLTLNIPIGFLTVNVNIYNENDLFIGTANYMSETYIWDRMKNIDIDEFINNSRSGFDIKTFLKIDNVRYQRALMFFNRSFDDPDVSIRFIMLVSCLESLFNYRLRKEESITNRVSTICSNILSALDNNNSLYYDEIKSMYNKRSRFLHGDNDAINLECEKKLRKYTRIIIIFYSNVALKTHKSTNEMIQYLLKPEEYDLIEKLIISALLSKSFKEQQERAIELIEKTEGEKLGEEIKKYLLSNV